MYGALLGDIIGSPFEFDRGDKTKNFDLFTKGCEFTDDSVMTIAVAEALMNAGKDADDETIKQELISSMQKWGHKYPNAGYGLRFIGWLRSKNPQPYNSCGNGSAMRVSAAGWLYDTIERTREVAALTAVVSHNHPEGIKAAEATASAIFMARHGASKEEIKDYIVKEFHYDLSRTCDEIRPDYYHIELAQKTVPEAITAFLEASDFEDAIRTAVSLGGDCDTLAAITGSIAEAFYGIPVDLAVECQNRLADDLKEVLFRFQDMLNKSQSKDETAADYEKNSMIREAVHVFYQAKAENNHELALHSFKLLSYFLAKRSHEEGGCPMPFVEKSGLLSQLNPEDIHIGQTLTLEEPMRLVMDTMQDGEGNLWLPLFTDEKEMNKGKVANVIMWFPIKDLILAGLEGEDVKGIVVNPFDESFILTKEMLKTVSDISESMKEQKKVKSTPQDRIKIFQDTQDWIKSDKELSASVIEAKKHTEVVYERDYPAFDASRTCNTKIVVTDNRSFEAAIKLHRENPNSKIAVMNFANAFHPGGGVVSGASAQEECLCRCSTLYPLLYRKTLKDKFYDYHKNKNNPKATDTLIYTEGVVICKTDEEFPQRMPRKDWVKVDVITIAAPDLRSKSNKYASLADGGSYMNDAELFGYHVRRAMHVLTTAAAKGADTLVLGAFGCGAFANNPEVVARAYKIALQEFPKVFRKIEFAVYCSPKDRTNYETFKRVLG